MTADPDTLAADPDPDGAAAAAVAPQLTLGPILYNWPAETIADFYRRIADEAPVDVVYVGEVVCSKRAPTLETQLPEVIDRLRRGGKRVVLSTLALIMSEREAAWVAELAEASPVIVEANDVSTIRLMTGRRHVVGPFVNIYNEGGLAVVARAGATIVALPSELPAPALGALARAAAAMPVALEVQVFGRLPLAISSRCYHARSRGLHRDGCQFVCGDDPDGLAVDTLDDQPFLAINGTQTLSHKVASLIDELHTLTRLGIRRFRLWPQAVDMVAVAELHREVLSDALAPDAGAARLSQLVTFAPFANGYFKGVAGVRHVGNAAAMS